MTALASFALLTAPTSVNPSPAGVEVAGARRLVDFGDLTYARCSYAGGGLLGNCAVGVSYSLDGGTSWAPLLPPGPTLEAAAGTVLASQWVHVEWLNADALLAPVAYGTTLLAGALGLTLYSLTFVELQLR